MVTYTENINAINHILTDDISNAIYHDFEPIFAKRGYEKSFNQDELLRKYNNHYLVYYFSAEFFIIQKNIDKAVEQYELCLKKTVHIPDVFLSYAITLHKAGQIDRTMEVIVRGLKHHQNDVKLLNFYGVLLYQQKKHKQAYEIFKRIVKNIGDPEAYNNFAFSCSSLGKHKKANAFYEKGLEVLNNAIERQLIQNKLLNYDYIPKLESNTFEEYLKSNIIFKSLDVKCPTYQHNKLRIGYVSGDFKNHVASFFIKTLLQNFNRSQFDVYCFSNLLLPDETTKELQKIPNIGWVDIYNIKPEIVGLWIRQIEIDILIDLSGHTAGNRLDVFALKPAPIQVTYLGFPNTTGLKTMDYRLCDCITDPENTSQQFSEELVRLQKCFICYNRDIPFTPNVELREKNDKVIFAVTNKEQKYNKYTYRAWNRIINEVPNSILIIKDCDFQQLNLPPTKIMKMDYFLNNQEYLELYNQIDVCLDTFPYSGTTTTCDTLLTSTPIITLAMENRHVSNVTNSILTHMGHTELVSHSLDDYIKKAVELGKDRERITMYKKTLRQKFLDLMNPVEFMKDYEDTLMKLKPK